MLETLPRSVLVVFMPLISNIARKCAEASVKEWYVSLQVALVNVVLVTALCP